MSRYNIIFADSSFKNFLTKKENNYYNNNKKYRETRDRIIDNLNSKQLYGCTLNSFSYSGMIHYIPTNEEKDIYKSADIIIYIPKFNYINRQTYISIRNLLSSYFEKCSKKYNLNKDYLNSKLFLLRSIGREQLIFFKNNGFNIENIINIKN